MTESLIESMNKPHTTALGAERIRRNLGLDEPDVVAWCRSRVLAPDAHIEKRGKNWYVTVDGCVITVNAASLTIITAHRKQNLPETAGY